MSYMISIYNAKKNHEDFANIEHEVLFKQIKKKNKTYDLK